MAVRISYPDITGEDLESEWIEGGREGGKDGGKESVRSKKHIPMKRVSSCVCAPFSVGVGAMLMPYGAGAFTSMSKWQGRRDINVGELPKRQGTSMEEGRCQDKGVFLMKNDNYAKVNPTTAGIPLSVFHAQFGRLRRSHKNSVGGWSAQGYNLAG